MFSSRSKRIMEMVKVPCENHPSDDSNAVVKDDTVNVGNLSELNDDEILAASLIIEGKLLESLKYGKKVHETADYKAAPENRVPDPKVLQENNGMLEVQLESELANESEMENEFRSEVESESDYVQENENLERGNEDAPENESSQNESDAVRPETTNETARNDDRLTLTKKRKESNLKRLHGENYIGYKRSKEKVITHNTPKGERTIKARCTHAVPKKTTPKSFLCGSIGDEDRKHIFGTFWAFNSWNEKRIFVTGLVEKRPIRRRRKETGRNGVVPKKKEGHDYFLVSKSGKRTKVCRLFFLNTLDLGEDTLKRWTKEGLNHGDFDSSSDSASDSGSNHRSNKKIRLCRKARERDQLTETVTEWLNLIPKVPSHYCRASSSKQYVDNSLKSKSHMHRIFKDWCAEKNKKVAHLKLFKSVLNKSKIDIHQPRKDQCDICCGFKTKNISQEEYDAHIIKKNEGRAAKARMKESCSDSRLVVTVDLQSVLTCPKLLASKSYYKLKLQVHNFTIYALNDRKVTLYVWHEANGGVTSNEFTSCLIDYFNALPENYKTIIVISDGCNYQNRNKTLSSALSDFCKEKRIAIQQLYLEKGHTMMEADSVHSTLEQYFIPPINSPSEYISLMRMARKVNPYDVKSLDYSFFVKYESPTNFKSIRPGKKAGDPQVVDLRQLKYLPNGEVYYTLDYSENWQTLPNCRINKTMNSYPRLYKRKIPISDDKWSNLQDLKAVIEKDHHPFYDTLPHEKKK